MRNQTDYNLRTIDEFRANAGKVGRGDGGSVVLITTVGAKSGRLYTTPVMYLRDGDRLAVFATHGGSPTSPDWYHNMVANPVITVEVGSETYQAKATVAAEEERVRLYTRQAELFPNFAEYQQKTTRKIPVVLLERIS